MQVIRKQQADLGPWRSEEIIVGFLFISLVTLWFSRDPKFVPGWQSLFTHNKVFVEHFILKIEQFKLSH